MLSEKKPLWNSAHVLEDLHTPARMGLFQRALQHEGQGLEIGFAVCGAEQMPRIREPGQQRRYIDARFYGHIGVQFSYLAAEVFNQNRLVTHSHPRVRQRK